MAMSIGVTAGSIASIASSSSTTITAGSTESSERRPPASSRFCTGVRRLTQYSAREALERSASSNEASTARGLRERV
nr:hypothetical protein [Burkholderia gladioli]